MLVEPERLIANFVTVAGLAGVTLTSDAISTEILMAPHRAPTSLPEGKMGVYSFTFDDRCLKVGKAGPNSPARYTSQHYNPSSSRSNLAKSLLHAQTELGLVGLTPANVGDWIKRHTHRCNFLLDASVGIPVLSLLESFLQCRLRPLFEGFACQR